MSDIDLPCAGRLPIDILPAVARQLVGSGSFHTLSTLLSLSTDTHRRLGPLLYCHLAFRSDRQLLRFLQCLDPREAGATAKQRLLDILQAVETIHLDVATGRDTTALILDLAETLPSHGIFRNVKTMSVSEHALGQTVQS